MNAHPTDSLPAYVLGALSPGEAAELAEHLAACPLCRADAESYRATLDALAAPDLPPERVKRRVFERIGLDQDIARLRMQVRALRLALAVLLVCALALGTLAAYTRDRQRSAEAALAQSQRENTALRGQIAQQQQQALFAAAPQTLVRRLTSPAPGASAAMYMQPGSDRAVLVVQGLPVAAAGTTYQFWFARAGEQVASATFAVAADGSATLALEAPAPVAEYEQVMVTVEASGGSQQPSTAVVLSGTLASALRPPRRG